MKKILSQNERKFKQIQTLIKEMTNGPEEKLVRFFHSKGFTFQQMADVLGISKQALNNKYPDLVKHRKEQRENSR